MRLYLLSYTDKELTKGQPQKKCKLNKFFFLIRKRENHLRGEGFTPKVPFYLGTSLVSFAYFFKSADDKMSKIFYNSFLITSFRIHP